MYDIFIWIWLISLFWINRIMILSLSHSMRIQTENNRLWTNPIAINFIGYWIDLKMYADNNGCATPFEGCPTERENAWIYPISVANTCSSGTLMGILFIFCDTLNAIKRTFVLIFVLWLDSYDLYGWYFDSLLTTPLLMASNNTHRNDWCIDATRIHTHTQTVKVISDTILSIPMKYAQHWHLHTIWNSLM